MKRLYFSFRSVRTCAGNARSARLSGERNSGVWQVVVEGFAARGGGRLYR